MISLCKEEINDNAVITLVHNSNKLRIVRLDDGIEWIFQSFNGDNTFVITMDDYELFECFFSLYRDISLGNILSDEELEELYNTFMCNKDFLDINKDFRESLQYKKVFKDGIIHYVSDAYLYDGDEVTISAGEDYVKLDFFSSRPNNCKVIKILDKEINYFNLSKPFLRHFDKLVNTDLEYHQLNFYDITKKPF